MIRNVLTMALGCAALVAVSGCVSTRTYVVDRPRVDQGVPGEENKGPVKTRKMVVLEVVEKDKAAPKTAQGQEPAPEAAVVPSAPQENFTPPQGGSPAATAAPQAAEPVSYVVQKDDTLQKIAKRSYGSYSKWTKIYDANRDVIKDPNFLKPGVTLKIPALDEKSPTPSK